MIPSNAKPFYHFGKGVANLQLTIFAINLITFIANDNLNFTRLKIFVTITIITVLLQFYFICTELLTTRLSIGRM